MDTRNGGEGKDKDKKREDCGRFLDEAVTYRLHNYLILYLSDSINKRYALTIIKLIHQTDNINKKYRFS